MNRKLMMIMAVVLSFALLIGCAKNNSSDSSSATNSGSKNSTDVKPEEKPSTSSPKEIRIGADAWMVVEIKN